MTLSKIDTFCEGLAVGDSGSATVTVLTDIIDLGEAKVGKGDWGMLGGERGFANDQILLNAQFGKPWDSEGTVTAALVTGPVAGSDALGSGSVEVTLPVPAAGSALFDGSGGATWFANLPLPKGLGRYVQLKLTTASSAETVLTAWLSHARETGQ